MSYTSFNLGYTEKGPIKIKDFDSEKLIISKEAVPFKLVIQTSEKLNWKPNKAITDRMEPIEWLH
jgi:hypothetical protein